MLRAPRACHFAGLAFPAFTTGVDLPGFFTTLSAAATHTSRLGAGSINHNVTLISLRIPKPASGNRPSRGAR